MSVQRINITTYAPASVGAISRVRLVSQSVTGPVGPQGDSLVREARSDWVAPNSYIGVAKEGSLESAAVWKVTRVTVSGSTVTTAVASPIKWTDRLTAVYS